VSSHLPIVILLACAACTQPQAATKEISMPTGTTAPATTLHIDLQEGFQQDAVIIRIDGKQVFKQEKITTDQRIGRAAGAEATTSKAEVELEVEMPKRKLKASQRVKPAEAAHIGVNIEGGKLQFRSSAHAFYYM
jgi:hypothetical protein